MRCEDNTQWRKERDGSRTCKHCGSLHPEDFIDIMWRYSQYEDGYHFDMSTKGYKRYGNRPNVQNAHDGGIKFYVNHLTPAYRDEFLAAQELAYGRYKKDMEERWGPGNF